MDRVGTASPKSASSHAFYTLSLKIVQVGCDKTYPTKTHRAKRLPQTCTGFRELHKIYLLNLLSRTAHIDVPIMMRAVTDSGNQYLSVHRTHYTSLCPTFSLTHSLTHSFTHQCSLRKLEVVVELSRALPRLVLHRHDARVLVLPAAAGTVHERRLAHLRRCAVGGAVLQGVKQDTCIAASWIAKT